MFPPDDPCSHPETLCWYIFIYTYALFIRVLVIGRIYTYTRSVAQRCCSCTPSQSIGLVLGSARFLCWMPLVFFFGFTHCVLLYDNKTNTRMFMTIGIRLKKLFDTKYFGFWNLSPPRMFLSLDLLPEYRLQHGTIGPLYVTSRYSTRIYILQGSFRLCHWLCLWRLVSWINHFPRVCWSTLWKSTFKQQ